MARVVATAVALCASFVVNAADLVVALPDRDSLVLQVPAGWESRVDRPHPDLPPTVTLSSPQPLGFEVHVTPMGFAGGAGAPQQDDIRRFVEGAARQAAPQSVEQRLPLQELSAPGKSGYYFSATDRNPGPNEYTYLTQGALIYGDLIVTFTVLANGKPEPVAAQALEMLRTLQRSRGKAGTA